MAKKVNQPSSSGFMQPVVKVEAETPVVAKKEKKKASEQDKPTEEPAVAEVEKTDDVADAKTEDTDTTF